MKKTIPLVGLSLVLSACAATLPPDVTPTRSAALPYEARPLHHHSPVGSYTHRVAVEPRPWRQQNDTQAPGAGQ